MSTSETSHIQPKSEATRFIPALGFMVSAMALGAGYLHPMLWWSAWAGVALLAASASATRGRLMRGLGVWCAITAGHFIGFPWTPWMFEFVLNEAGKMPWLYATGMSLMFAIPVATCAALATSLLPRRVPARISIPTAWALGELARLEITRIGITDWMLTQWQVEVALRAVGHMGWWLALWLCMFVAASAGELLVKQPTTRARAVIAAPALLVLLVLLALPALDRGDLSQLEGVALAHTHDPNDLPGAAPTGRDLDLVVWPEAALNLIMTLPEGEARRAVMPTMLPGSDAEHLVGMITRPPFSSPLNQVLRVDADGVVLHARAKRGLALVAEEKFLGLGTTRYRRGRGEPVMRVGGRELITAICSEGLDRRIVARGEALGGELLVVPARDGMMPHDIARRQQLASQVFRSVEYGVPSLRASFDGWSSIVAADGSVLAISKEPRNHLLSWSEAGGVKRTDFYGRDFEEGDPEPEAPEPAIAVLYSRRGEHMRTPCAEGMCSYHALEDFACDERVREAVIVTGHAAPPQYLSHGPDALAKAIGCYNPSLIVVDACYGASSDLIGALGSRDAIFVGATRMLPLSGLMYEGGFFARGVSAKERAGRVFMAKEHTLTRLELGDEAFGEAMARMRKMSASQLQSRLARRSPPQVAIELEGGGTILVPVEWERVRPPR